MQLDWDPEVDTPATIAIIGGGPLGVEAALYARFLGYFVMLSDQRKVGDSLTGWNQAAFRNATDDLLMQSSTAGEDAGVPCWRDCTTPLGLAALEAQAGSAALPPVAGPVNYRDYVDKYLIPVARTDLLYDSIQVHARVVSVSRVGCSPQDSCSLERRSEQEFRLLIDSKNRGEFTQLADIVLDCSGMFSSRRGLASGGSPAIGEGLHTNQMFLGKCDVRGTRRERFAGKHCLLFGSNLEACANALELLELAQAVPTTKLTWVIPKRLGTKGFQLATNLLSASAIPPTVQTLIDRAKHAIDNELDHLVPLAAWGIEALNYNDLHWTIKLQTTEDETLQVAADVFINCAEPSTHRRYLAELRVDARLDTEAAPLDTLLDTLTAEPHYYQLGQRAVGPTRMCTLQAGFAQIRQTFAAIGGRQELDLYATVKPREG